MGYKGESFMDWGYFVGTDGGMLYIPPIVPGQPQEPSKVIPWEAFLNDEPSEDSKILNEVG